jgi:hypothetical protein
MSRVLPADDRDRLVDVDRDDERAEPRPREFFDPHVLMALATVPTRHARGRALVRRLHADDRRHPAQGPSEGRWKSEVRRRDRMSIMDVTELLLDLYGRTPPLAEEAVSGLTLEQLQWQPQPGANTIAWLVWHLARIQDDYVAGMRGDVEQLWVTDGWAAKFGLDPDPDNHGYGHSSEEIGTVRPESSDVLLGYLSAVDERVRAFLATLSADDLDQVIDENWDPPVTLGVRTISIADDSLQHVGQANYLRGLIDR